jgi:hypothetical protein
MCGEHHTKSAPDPGCVKTHNQDPQQPLLPFANFALLLRVIPADKVAMPAFDRAWLALVLTCQVFAGAFLGIAAQAFLAIGVIFYLLPWLGFGLLDTAREVAAFDLPVRVLRLWWANSP